MDDLAGALRDQQRRSRRLKRLRLATRVLLALAVAGAIWQLVRLGAVPSWEFLRRWWPALGAGAALVAAGVLWWRNQPRPTSRAATSWVQVGGIVSTLTAVGALVFTAASLAASRDQIDVARQGQLTDRFTRAVDQLGTQGPEHLPLRLGGIYALERIAVDSPRDQLTMVEILSAFIRASSPRADGVECPPTPADVEAAFVVLTRRDVPRDPRPVVIDLTRTCLTQVDAVGANLTGVALTGANLTDANLNISYLDLTGLSGATLVGASFYGADFRAGYIFAGKADFTNADLSGARLGGSDFSGSDFTEANLRGADLGYADFSGADLTGALHNENTKADHAVRDGGTVGAWW